MLPAGMGLDGVRAALMLGAMRSLIAVPPSFTMQLPLSGVALGVVVGVGVGSATSCVGVGLAGGSVAVGVTVAVGVRLGSGVPVGDGTSGRTLTR